MLVSRHKSLRIREWIKTPLRQVEKDHPEATFRAGVSDENWHTLDQDSNRELVVTAMTIFPTKVLSRVPSMGGRLSLYVDARGLNDGDVQDAETEPALDINELNLIRDGRGNLAVLEYVVRSWDAPKQGEPITLIFGRD